MQLPIEAIEFHLQHPDIGPGEYLHAREMLLAAEVLKRTRIFLDTRYWLLIRDHLRGTRRNPQIGRLYDALLELVGAKRAVCPVSVTVVAEVLKQNDRASRMATAELIERLSESVVIQPEPRRIRREVRSFVSRAFLGTTYPPLVELVWTRPWWMVVGPEPMIGTWPPEFRRAAAKASIDFLWDASIVDYVRGADAWPLQRPYSELHNAFPQFAADQLNEGRSDPWQDLGTFDNHFLAQLEVALEMHRHDIEDVLDILFEREFGTTIGVSAATESRAAAPVCEWIRTAFRENRVGTELPFFRIIPGILTAFELNRAKIQAQRPYRFLQCGHRAAVLRHLPDRELIPPPADNEATRIRPTVRNTRDLRGVRGRRRHRATGSELSPCIPPRTEFQHRKCRAATHYHGRPVLFFTVRSGPLPPRR